AGGGRPSRVQRMGKRTGLPRGRPAGAKNKRTLALQAAAQEAAKKIQEAIGESAFDGDAHSFLVWLYKNPAIDLPTRMRAAELAAPYEKPKLLATEVSGGMLIEQPREDLSDLKRALVTLMLQGR